jgi:hypothetical protein
MCDSTLISRNEELLMQLGMIKAYAMEFPNNVVSIKIMNLFGYVPNTHNDTSNRINDNVGQYQEEAFHFNNFMKMSRFRTYPTLFAQTDSEIASAYHDKKQQAEDVLHPRKSLVKTTFEEFNKRIQEGTNSLNDDETHRDKKPRHLKKPLLDEIENFLIITRTCKTCHEKKNVDYFAQDNMCKGCSYRQNANKLIESVTA